MDLKLKTEFLSKWNKYFGEAELPLTCWYSELEHEAMKVAVPKGHCCIICELSKVRHGDSLFFNAENLGCGGSRRYLGYAFDIRPNFEYFLSCGIPGELEGERYIKTPEMVNELMAKQHQVPANGRNLIFKRWDHLTENDRPEIVFFFATPDVLSGLFTLANFDQSEPNSTFCPFGAGCGSIIHYPFHEIEKERQRAVIGMFDPSARPCVPANTLSFAVPMKKFTTMIQYMDESFLITDTWETVRKRISSKKSL